MKTTAFDDQQNGHTVDEMLHDKDKYLQEKKRVYTM